MAIEPKTPRKRAAKKVAEIAVEKTESVAKKSPEKKNAPAIPVPIFQAATAAEVKPVRAPRSKSPADEPMAAPVVKKVTSRKKAVPSVVAVPEPEVSLSNTDSEGRGRRRRRGGRGRRRPNEMDVESPDLGVNEELDSEKSATHRRRRRRSAADGVTAGESVEEDGVVTVVKVREAREPREVRERPARATTRERAPRRGREARTEYREPYRKRGTIITEGEFLARRENVGPSDRRSDADLRH